MKRYFNLLLICFAAVVFGGCTSLGDKPVFQSDGNAIKGYDPVAYFKQDKAVKGSPAIHEFYNGAKWHFSSENNRKLFVANPSQYLPQYGGYCAYAMSKGFVVSTDPEAFSLNEGKLYLNYSVGVRETWQEDIPNHVKLADGHWLTKTAADKADR